MNPVLIIIILLPVSFLLTYIIKVGASRFNVIDTPNKRSSHSSPVPRGGGLAIVLSWYIGIILLYVDNQIDKNLFFALLSGVILAFVSFVDDLISLKPAIRLIGQSISVILAVYFLKGLWFIDVSGLILDCSILFIPFVIVGTVWFINLYNFLDGIDGYASVEAITVSVILYLFTGNLLCLLIIACVTGFLIWNWPKAKIFMGDIGSTQLGFIIVILGIYLNNENEFDFLMWILLTSPFWFDATFTLFRRFKNKERLSEAHKKHAYQRLVQSGFTSISTNLSLMGLNLFIALTIFTASKYGFLTLPFFFIVIALLILINYQIDKRMPFN